MRICIAFGFLWMATLANGQGSQAKKSDVPDSTTATRIAVAHLVPVYGKKQIESEEPFTAELKDNVWIVSGTLRCPDGKGGFTNNCAGGVAVVRISKKDAHVISMIHYK